MDSVHNDRKSYESNPGRKRAIYADPDHRPEVLPPDLDAIPQPLRNAFRWVLWRLVWKPNKNGGGKWDKVPYQINGQPAKSNDSQTWASFEAVATAYRAGGFDGVGFVLGGGFVGIDLDDVRDPATGTLTPGADELIREFATYSEISPSGTGVKLFGLGEWLGDWHKAPFPGGGEIEGYSVGRYFTVTGRPITSAEVADIHALAEALAERLDPSRSRSTSKQTENPRQSAGSDTDEESNPDDEELIRRAREAKNGAKFAKLWDGDSSDHGGDPSRADLALCGMLAFWCGGDTVRMDRLFRRSQLMRPKWDERRGKTTYGERTIAKAIKGKTEFYTPPRKRKAEDEDEEPPKPPPLAEVLAGIGLALPLCHDATQTGFATVGRLTHPIRSTAFRQYLLQEYRKRNAGKVPSAEARAAALDAIEAAAVHDNPEHPVHVRFAGHMGRVYLHLADDDSTVIEMDADGWRVCPNPPVRFRKPPGMLPLPMPRPGGSLDPLQKYVNVPEGSGFALVVGWLMGTFQPAGPFPVLVLLGEQGSAKTTTARVLKRLIDPSAAGVRTSPRDERDLMIQARNGWVLAFDNLSGLRGWFSDALCRLATGGGFGTRKLYTDDEEMIFDAKRPQIVNGIEDFITRADLLERSILTRHPPIPEENRRPESEFWKAFDAEHADLLGAVLDRVSAGLRELPRVRPEKLPRMADFALFAVACEQGAGEEEEFRSAYEENQAGAHEQALDSSLLPAAILAFMENREKWEGRPAELLGALQAHAPDPPPKDWPKQPNLLTNRLRRLAPNLRQVHRLNVDCDSREPGGKSGGKRKRVVRIERVTEKARERPSPPSPPSPDLDLDPGNPVILDVRQGDDGDDGDGPLHPFSGRTFTNDDRPHKWRG